MDRAPFQVLVFPYLLKDAQPIYALFKRRDLLVWQGVAGGGRSDETPERAAVRELQEETGISDATLVRLDIVSRLPATAVGPHWDSGVVDIPEYAFGADTRSLSLALSDEHVESAWLSYGAAIRRLQWESNRRALAELDSRLICDRPGQSRIVIRPYEVQDKPEVERILRAGLQVQADLEPQAADGSRTFLAEEWSIHAESLTRGGPGWWIAESQERIAGIMWVVCDDDRLGRYASVRQLCVAPEVRGGGIGAQLLVHADRVARESGVVMLLISTHRANPAQRLYERMGFVDLPAVHRLEPDPNQRVMWKPFVKGLG